MSNAGDRVEGRISEGTMRHLDVPIPRATYRLQFTKDFGFRNAADIAPYLEMLGVSHVYASPYLKARPGSTHGYDIVSHVELNPELGSQTDFDDMVKAFKQHGLGQILDFVPNHMGVGGSDNPWWLDVLEWGPGSEFAGWFDIDWRSDHQYLRDKVLIAFLGEQYGVALESGVLELKFDPEQGTFAVWAYDTHKLPICPRDYGIILGNSHSAVERLGDAFSHLSDRQPHITNRARELKAQLAELYRENAEARAAVDRAVTKCGGVVGEFESWADLDALIAKQFWRPAHFKVAADDINYRRFFNVNDLAGIRMEIPELFGHAHSLIFRLLEDSTIDGIRLDHVDGLFDPKSYCLRIREKAPRPFYLLVEKILAPHERLREDWNVDGTTGYEFANLVTGLLIDPAGEECLSRFYAEFTGNNTSFEDIVSQSKLQIMEDEMASELNVLAREAGRIARSNPRTADFTENVLRHALRGVIAGFPVYRSYIDESGITSDDRRDLDWAFSRARRSDSRIDDSVYNFLYALMSGDLVDIPRSGYSRSAVMRFIMRAQQYSGPVMAKGLEDTAFYRYNRLLALNEVGGQPQRFSVSVAAFHQANAERARWFPHAMLSSSSHDTKRGEDARARIAVLSELADDWVHQVTHWHRILRPEDSGPFPDTNDEYVFYQMLVGSWPAELVGGAPEQLTLDAFRERIEAATIKALREAKVHSTWASPNVEYEDAMIALIRRSLDSSRKNLFLESFLAFQERVAVFGWHNSVVQLVLKMTVPGVPDIYQGADAWDFSMVDPDNRRTVDFAARIKATSLDKRLVDQLDRWQDGELKLWLTHALLQTRKRFAKLFEDGSYRPLEISGDGASDVCAFLRSDGVDMVAVVVKLYPSRRLNDETVIVRLPKEGSWYNVLEDRPVQNDVELTRTFDSFPAAVFVSNRT